MRSRRSLVLVLSVFLVVGSLPMQAAAPVRDGDGWFDREFKAVSRFVKAVVRKVAIITYSDGMTPPKP